MTDREENEIVECKKLKIAKVRFTTTTWLTTDSSLFFTTNCVVFDFGQIRSEGTKY